MGFSWGIFGRINRITTLGILLAFCGRGVMDCSCTATHPDEDDSVTGWSERILKAAKPHLCGECGSTINKGDRFLFGTIFKPGEIHNYKVCIPCKSIIDQFFRDGWVIGSMLDDLDNYFDGVWIDDLPSSCISKLSGRALHTVCDLLQKYQEEWK